MGFGGFRGLDARDLKALGPGIPHLRWGSVPRGPQAFGDRDSLPDLLTWDSAQVIGILGDPKPWQTPNTRNPNPWTLNFLNPNTPKKKKQGTLSPEAQRPSSPKRDQPGADAQKPSQRTQYTLIKEYRLKIKEYSLKIKIIGGLSIMDLRPIFLN